MKRIAIIPARVGSKRIPNKNIKKFCGKPIISYTLDTVNKSKLFDVIHVSTDSVEIANFVESIGFPVDFLRPDSLADDNTPIMPVLRWVLEQYSTRGQRFKEVASVMACAPFIEVSDLRNASKLLNKNNYDNAILSVAPYSAPIEWAFNRQNNGLLTPLQPGMFARRSQDFPVHYFDTGSFAFFSNEYVFNADYAGSDKSYIGQVIEKYKALDIDNIEDWHYAENLYYGITRE